MKNYFKILTLCLAVVVLFSTASFSEEKKEGLVKGLWNKTLDIVKHPVKELAPIPKSKTAPEAEPAPVEEKKSPWESITEEEICERIKYMIEVSPEASSLIPELKVTLDKNRNATKITYNVDGIAKDLKELDKETLIKIHNRVNNERARIQSERIQKQLEAMRASQRIPSPPPAPPKIPRLPQQPPTVPKPPPQPPTIPRPPQAPPTIPKPPPTPPQPPRR